VQDPVVQEEAEGQEEEEAKSEAEVRCLSVKQLRRRMKKSKALHKKNQQKKRKKREAKKQVEVEQRSQAKANKDKEPAPCRVATMTFSWNQLVGSTVDTDKTDGFSFLGGNASLPSLPPVVDAPLPMAMSGTAAGNDGATSPATLPTTSGSLFSVLRNPAFPLSLQHQQQTGNDAQQEDWVKTRRMLIRDYKSKKKSVQRYSRAIKKLTSKS